MDLGELALRLPTHVKVEFGFTNKIGDGSLAGFTLSQMFFFATKSAESPASNGSQTHPSFFSAPNAT